MTKRTSHRKRKLQKLAAREEHLRRVTARAHPVAGSLPEATEGDAALKEDRRVVREAVDAIIKRFDVTLRRLADM